MSRRIIGIDLGTTNSLVAIFENGTPRLLPTAHGGLLTPSIVGVLESGEVIVGDAAKDYRVTHPERCVAAFKRWMGQTRVVPLAGREFTPPELSSLVLRSLKADAEAALGGSIEEAVITVPAYFNDQQRRATRHAGELAGLKVLRIINEPTAAALTYGFHDRAAAKKLLVIDLGGGTFDVTLMEVFEGTLEIIATAGESFLGGEDFTDRLVATVLNTQKLSLEAAEMRFPLMVARLCSECEQAKRRLLKEESATVRIPDEQGRFAEDAPTVTITRESFARDMQSLLDRLRGPIDKVLRDGNLDPRMVEDVLLVGGATRMPAVVQFVTSYFGREPLCTFNPDEVVALGASIQAALIADDAAVEDLVMTDVCPHTLGVEIVKHFGKNIEDGFFSPIIHRNTTIPVSREETYSTIHPGQTEVTLQIYQGEARRVKDNLLLGELKVKGFPARAESQPFQVRFTYDLNGILEVEAYIPGSQKRFQIVLAQQAQALTPAEIRAAVAKMQALKFYPREDVHNQRLLLFCERIIGELPPYQRDVLEHALDTLERSMTNTARVDFESIRTNVIALLEELGFPFEDRDEATPE